GIFAKGLVKQGLDVAAYDILCQDQSQKAQLQARAQHLGVRLGDTLAEALDEADLVISAVTASSANEVAVAAAQSMHAGQVFMDINSVSPKTKQQDEEAIRSSAATYIEAAVMAPVPPYGLKVPILLGGSESTQLAKKLNKLGFNCRAVAPKVGVASAIK